MLYKLIKEHPGIQSNALASLIGKGFRTTERIISMLKASGQIEFRGSKKSGGYYPIENQNSNTE